MTTDKRETLTGDRTGRSDRHRSIARLQATGSTYWADPATTQPGQINHNHGGRGVYFLDPAGHGMETITRPYGRHVPPSAG